MSVAVVRESGGVRGVPPRRRVIFVVGPNAIDIEPIATFLVGAADAVIRCRTLSDVDVDVAAGSASVIVLAPDNTPGAQLNGAIRRFRARDRATAILLCLRSASGTHHTLAALARAGLDDFLTADNQNELDQLRRAVVRRLAHALPSHLVHAVMPQTTQTAECICAWCYRGTFRPLHAEDVADWLGRARKTIHRHLTDVGLPPLHRVLSHGRLLHIAYRLDTTLATIEAISRSLSFSSPRSLGTFVKREMGRSPSELRSRGAISAVRQFVLAEVAKHGVRLDGD